MVAAEVAAAAAVDPAAVAVAATEVAVVAATAAVAVAVTEVAATAPVPVARPAARIEALVPVIGKIAALVPLIVPPMALTPGEPAAVVAVATSLAGPDAPLMRGPLSVAENACATRVACLWRLKRGWWPGFFWLQNPLIRVSPGCSATS